MIVYKVLKPVFVILLKILGVVQERVTKGRALVDSYVSHTGIR
jgi:hypothetical protein